MIKKVLVIDDSALMRRVLSDIIALDKRFILEDSANDGLEALELITRDTRRYDIIVLDINMPKMNGIQFLEKMNSMGVQIPVLIVSTVAKAGAFETIRCLELGAFDFITKPDSFLETKSERFSARILKYMCTALAMTPPTDEVFTDAQSAAAASSSVLDGPMSYVKVTSFTKTPHVKVSKGARKLIAIASSTGGPKALQAVIPLIPQNIDAPLILVQHMPEGFTGTLAQRLDEMSRIHVEEAYDGAVLKRGTLYIAKGGRHIRIKKKGSDYIVELGDEAARNGLKPCADIMYESLTDLDLEEITCVVLTGMGSDGTRGIGQLGSKKNIYVIAQDEATSTVYGMPRMIKEAGMTDEVVPLGSVADAITKVVGTC